MTQTIPAKPAQSSGRPWGRIAAGIAALVVLVALGRQLGGYLPTFVGWVAACV